MFSRTRCLAPLVLTALCLGAPATARADFAHLTLQSEPGDFVGQGMNFDITYTSPDPSSISAQIRRSLPDGSPAELLFVLSGGVGDGSNTFSTLFFGTDQLGIPIQPGFYPMAERADFASPGHPGLDVSFQNRGSNMVFGSFTITDVTFFRDASNVLEVGTFSASFEQHSERPDAPALRGTFDYRNAAAPAPEPSTFTLLGLGGLGLLGYGWRGRKRAA
jgi:hypothetical protein